uniref:Uncharacterized protein n=1 Tax=Rhizophora mucronata TaxID=61149 RepID=A0A2P2Q7T2_RHIMU
MNPKIKDIKAMKTQIKAVSKIPSIFFFFRSEGRSCSPYIYRERGIEATGF